jgi:hypothetical protein
VTTIPLMPMVREALKGSALGLTLGDMRQTLLGLGVHVEAPELASCLDKLMTSKKVSRERVKRPDGTPGPREVWRYHWNH